ncbi:MAG: NAD(+) synthase, partial [Tissierellia bacterium]|nr:NAD(+) synthase [Tissierellia bacterium]
HALLVAKSLNLRTKKVDLSETYNIFAKTLGIEDVKDMAAANIKPRLRMTTLYYLAQRNNYLVLGCSNKSEFSIGYFTKYGDSGADLLPIASIVKRDIWKMAEHLNIPKEIIEKTPTAGLWEDQTDEEEMGFGYDVLDTFILEGTGPDEITAKIERMQRISEHKRKFPPIFTPKD